MNELSIAPEFELADLNGSVVRLSQFNGQKNLILAFLRSFM